MTRLAVALLAGALRAGADIYAHNPRGSNNRLDRGNGDTENPNRLFDSENNNAGGYGMGGDAEAPAAPLRFIVGSELSIEWTAQHSCGHGKARCQFVLQYYCNDDPSKGMNVRDGTTPARIDLAAPTDQTRGLHEPVQNYVKCAARERNMGLWTADQDMANRNRATATRQENNPNNRYGFECPEERDYYPYWHPTVWKDIAVLTTNVSMCGYYKNESQNVAAKHECDDPQFNNERACFQGGSAWVEVPSHGVDPPQCLPAPYLRDNHLGNTLTGGATMYNWTIPDDVSNACVLRMRYNISTADVPWELDSRYNNGNSPVKTNPRVDLGFGLTGGDDSQLELAINSDQHGRTFQDRTFRFEIVARPAAVRASAKVYNLNVRGKRGNIVQAYPSVEYDFAPSVLAVSPGAWIHFQWTGNDKTNNNGGNNGEGIDGTDRHNLVQIADLGSHFPLHVSQTSMFDVHDETTLDGAPARTAAQLAKEFALVRQTGCASSADAPSDQAANNCEKLNAAAPTVDLGLLRLKQGTYHFMSTRNNNFSNRGQKGTIHVQPQLPLAPVITSASAVGRDGLRIAWTMPAATLASGAVDASAPVQVRAFRVEMSEDGGLSWRGAARNSSTNESDGLVGGADSALVVTELPAGLTFSFRVSAETEDGWSDASALVAAMTADSADSKRYKALLKQAAVDRQIEAYPMRLGIGLAVLLAVVACVAHRWHHHGTLLFWRDWRRARPRRLLGHEPIPDVKVVDAAGGPSGGDGPKPAPRRALVPSCGCGGRS
ncbi:hypothetical protein KFE25_008144 [Diacronema lutheri]|uniref:Fibronectin type-III domain-containing protein n=1 Tax=Diacronema lutheri TaxID=2081491 RepID=A0A8J5XWI6_DIALT|nr:hypothetical protein KFE25_008144 [Diacronema lutheri]